MADAAVISILTGTLVNVFLHGVLTVQTYDYFMHFPNDRSLLKLLVHGLFVIENLQTALTLCDAYKNLATHTPSALFNMELVGLGSGIVTAIVAFITHTFYAYRIRVLSRIWWLACVVMLSSLFQLVFGIVVGVIVFHAKTGQGLQLWYTYGISLTWFGLMTWCDIIIAISMVALLSRSNTGFSTSTRRIVKRTIRLTVETGAITASVAVICFILIAGFRDQLYFAAFSISVTKWYSNTLLVQLNSRAKHVGDSHHVQEIQIAYSDTGLSAPQMTSVPRTGSVSTLHAC